MMGRHPYLSRFGAPSGEDLDKVEEVLRLTGLAEMSEKPVTELSGGEKQRVVLARALAQDTPVLILDEPTANLDVQHALEILSLISRRVKGGNRTAVSVMHDLNLTAAFSDRIVFLKNGRVHAAGPGDRVLTADNVREVFGVDAKIAYDDFSGSNTVVFRSREAHV